MLRDSDYHPNSVIFIQIENTVLQYNRWYALRILTIVSNDSSREPMRILGFLFESIKL